MKRTVKPMEPEYSRPALELVEDVFTKWNA